MSPNPRLRVVDSRATPRDAETEATQPEPEASRALEHIVARFDAFIRRSAHRHGLTGSDADEVVQDLRVRMWKSLGTADMIRRAKASYIYRTAVSASLDIIRRRRARKAESVDLDETVADQRRRSDERLEGDDVAKAVHRALNMLVESRRAVVRMHLAGYDRFEIAELLGWTEPRTRNLLYRGLADLREILTSWGIGPERAQ